MADKPTLTPGERILNWCKAAAIIVPLTGIGAVGAVKTSDTIKTAVREWVAEPVPTVNEIPLPTNEGFEKQTVHSLETIVKKLQEHDAAFDAINVEISKIKELVN